MCLHQTISKRPGKCSQALFVLPQKRDFSQRGCFSKNNKRCYFKLGDGRLYLDRLHKQVLADWHRIPVFVGSSFQGKQRDLLLMALEVSADESLAVLTLPHKQKSLGGNPKQGQAGEVCHLSGLGE